MEKSGRYLHNTALGHFGKLSRVRRRLLEREVHIDDLDDFVKTAWHLTEIVQVDPVTTDAQKRQATELRGTAPFNLAREIANAQKHLKHHPNAVVRTTTVKSGWGMGRFGMGGFGVGEQSISFLLKDGVELSAIEFVESIFGDLSQLFPDVS